MISIAAVPTASQAACETGGFCVYRPAGTGAGEAEASTGPLLLERQGAPSEEQLDLARLGGSASLIVQQGSLNSAVTNIISSPGSVVSQVQRGNSNASRVSVIGGELNRVRASQSGNGLVSDIYLINSEQTTVRSHQDSQSSQLRQLFVLYGKPGTVINLD